jgi:hypothetical protein
MEIALVVLSIISLSFMIAYVAIVKRLNTVSEGFAKLLMTYNMMLDDAEDKNKFLSPDDHDVHKENFIKFLSDSRDWAFDYIEEVQNGLKKFIEEVSPEIEYYDNYGVAVEGMLAPHDKALKKISKEFSELKKLLPEDTNDRR